MKVPKNCPWCQKPHVELSGREQTAVLGSIRYACGTSIVLYDFDVHVTSADAHPEKNGWHMHEDFLEMIQ